jgi:hypothetical protein
MNVSPIACCALSRLALLLWLPACQQGHPQAEARARQAVRAYVQRQVEGRGACVGGCRYVPGAFTLREFSDHHGTRYQVQHTYSAVWAKGDSIGYTDSFFVDSAGTVH